MPPAMAPIGENTAAGGAGDGEKESGHRNCHQGQCENSLDIIFPALADGDECLRGGRAAQHASDPVCTKN